METKQCKQCGMIKPIGQFRKYYAGRKGTYRTCKACERINSRAKYISNKGENATEEERAELKKIHTLWDAQRKLGLQPPHKDSGCNVTLRQSIDDMLDRYNEQLSTIQSTVQKDEELKVPAQLAMWLTEPLTEEPEYYQEKIYDELRVLYRPIRYINQDTMLPVYDDTYSPILDKILERFDNYEDTYYNK